MVRSRLLVVLLAAVAAIVIAQPSSSARGREGGILRVLVSPSSWDNYIDPALSYFPPGPDLLHATCARLYTYADKPSPAGYRLQPEVAERYTVSDDLKKYTFTLRRGFRFSDGKPLRASAFRAAINRVLQPSVDSVGKIQMRDIVGADDVLAGRTETARGVVARGNTLVVRLTRPAPDFVARTALPFFCSVPDGLPPSAEGATKFASAGPYYVRDYRPGDRIEIRRNPYYGGDREIHLAGFDVSLRGGTPFEFVRRLDRGEADWGYMVAGTFMTTPGLDLVSKYGLNKSRFFVKHGLTLRMLVFNLSRPLFRENVRLRQAINYLLDRRALLPAGGGPVVAHPTDQHVPQGVPGFWDANIYPLRGNLAKAKLLSRGHLRTGKAVLYTTQHPNPIETALIVKGLLAKIGLDVEIRKLPYGLEYLTTLTTAPRAEWDIAYVLGSPGIPDAHAYLKLLLASELQGGETLTRLRWQRARAALARAARLPHGRARNRAYAQVDEMIARDLAPVAMLSTLDEATLVSDRLGCKVFRPRLDLAVACLKK